MMSSSISRMSCNFSFIKFCIFEVISGMLVSAESMVFNITVMPFLEAIICGLISFISLMLLKVFLITSSKAVKVMLTSPKGL